MAESPLPRMFWEAGPERVQAAFSELLRARIATGLGFAGRPGGPLPSIKVRLTGLTYDYIVLGTMLGLPDVPMSGLVASVTAEDMRGG